ncbi:hypothetical protein POSPLADRAFT_1039590 [Postia placenta MAD-698-R-SB12]|uniref:Uncharacterized protein n=1 Tax=Postia placenta MAD-698-R-SB12 TaxID=670580 RepID=A0A1X6N4I7_9APHY|nr:hypothetical protein POSPLADRAFT_1039590 [Postia placenta MAD-698-R-SB12]OSX63559.1 hypothetical protein POSPLADRAFT_1039590 [Postia placenta MAD-698-R-SB12]
MNVVLDFKATETYRAIYMEHRARPHAISGTFSGYLRVDCRGAPEDGGMSGTR